VLVVGTGKAGKAHASIRYMDKEKLCRYKKFPAGKLANFKSAVL